MVRKIENYLAQGLPARVYLLCFLKPSSGYALANEIYGRPITAKVYKWANIMVEAGYLQKLEEAYKANVGPLVDEIRKNLQEQSITIGHTEKKLLAAFLESESFRQVALMYYEGLSKEEQEDAKIIPLLTDILPLLSSLSFNAKHLDGSQDVSPKEALALITTEKEVMSRRISLPGIDSNLGDFNRLMKGYFAKVGLREEADNFDMGEQVSRYAPYSLFQDLPNSLLIKLSRLSPIGGYVTFIFALSSSLLFMKLKEEIENQLRAETDDTEDNKGRG